METKLGFSIEILGAQDAVTAAEELRRKITEVQKALKAATSTDDISRLGKELVDLKAKQAEVNKEVREQVRVRQEELTNSNKAGATYRELSKRLNDLRHRYKDMAAAEQEATQEAQDLLQEITLLDRRLKKIDADVGQFQRNVGGYTDALSQFFPRIGGSIGDVSDSIGFLKGQTGALGKGFGGLLVAFTAFNAISDIFAGLNEQIKETRQLQNDIANLTGQTGEALQQGAAQSKAIAETYNESAQEIAVAANTVSKELGVTFTDALTLVEAGFRKGANAQGEFLDVLREYPAQFRDAGASAEDFLAVSIAASQEGIYSDKGLDAVKEFGLRIREQTKATRDALQNALGKEFTDELFGNINNGSVTSSQALGKVTEALKANGVQGSQLQTVIADVFGGPGEDVGQRFLFTLGDILNAQNDILVSTNEYQAQQEELYKANLALEESQNLYTAALNDYSFELEVAEKQGRALLNNTLAKIFEFLNLLPARFQAFKAAFSSIFPKGGIIDKGFENFKSAAKGAFDFLGRIYKPIFKSIAESETVQAARAAFSGTLQAETKKIKEDDAKQRKALEADRARQQKEEANRRNEQAKQLGASTQKAFVEGSVAALQAEKNRLEQALENTIGEAAQRRVIASIAAIEARLEQQVQNIERLRLEGERAGDAGLRAPLPGIGSLVLTNTEVAQVKSTEKAKTDAVFEQVKKRAAIRREEIKKSEEDEKERKLKILDQIGQFSEAGFQILSAFAARRQELENRRFDEEISKTEANIQRLETQAQNASGIRARILQKQIQQQQEVLKRQQEEADAARRKRAKQEKAVSVIQSIIFGALGVSRALAQSGIVGAIAAGVLAAAQTATIIAQPLATGGIVGISGRRVNDRQNMPSRANGDNVLATVRRGEVVLNERQQSALGGARTFRAIGVPGFAEGGAIGAPNIAAIRSASAPGGDIAGLLAQLDAKTDAINARIDRLKAFVVTEEIARDMQEASNLKIQATL